jgi:hypothetical protein
MKKQTAVEWLAEIVCKMGYVSSNIVEQAKEMEKEQIKRAFIDGEENVWDRHKNEHKFEFDTHSDYYEKTYQKSNMPEIEKMTKDLSIFEDLAAMIRPK